MSHPIPRSDPRLRCRPKDGWRGLIYRNRSGAIDPPACTRGSALGLRKITLKDDRATSRGIAVTLVARGTRLDAPHGPLRLTIALGATGDDLLAGLCAVQQFSLRRCLSGGDRFACK